MVLPTSGVGLPTTAQFRKSLMGQPSGQHTPDYCSLRLLFQVALDCQKLISAGYLFTSQIGDADILSAKAKETESWFCSLLKTILNKEKEVYIKRPKQDFQYSGRRDVHRH